MVLAKKPVKTEKFTKIKKFNERLSKMMDSSAPNISKPKKIYLKDYQKNDYLIEHVDLTFDLDPEKTKVTSKVVYKYQPKEKAKTQAPLKLNGENLNLIEVKLNDQKLSEKDYSLTEEHLVLDPQQEKFTLTIQTEINPKANHTLEGLYISQGIFCTQNEAEGFRRITYFLDRPDIMATYQTKIIASQKECPVLLANGNLIDSGKLENERHFAVWQDPHKKPCYLFALVAGDLAGIEDTFVTSSKKEVTLKIFAKPEWVDRLSFAMESLKKAMKWDEENYQREYDLDIFMIVAVDDFNFGAMENKGLNVFNSSLIIADPKTASDDDFLRIQSVIGHEYFHNWTGNRITLRDWFQLSLKEGLTVFRDQCFSQDMFHEAVGRIMDVRHLKQAQFAEDQGPMAHPVRPDHYIKIDNFYTSTVYEKGAEVIRMLRLLVGKPAFDKAMQVYFERFDGQAITVEDLLFVFEETTKMDLSQFELWYTQKGTPRLAIQDNFDPQTKTYTLTVEQKLDPKQKQKPWQIPLEAAFFDEEGNLLTLSQTQNPTLLVVDQENNQFVFEGFDKKPIPSLFRGFSAPVHYDYDYSLTDLKTLAAKDSDLFNRWYAANTMFFNEMLGLVKNFHHQDKLSLKPEMIDVFEAVIQNEIDGNESFYAEVMQLPRESVFDQYINPIDIEAIHCVREWVLHEIAERFRDSLIKRYHELAKTNQASRFDALAIGQRQLKNIFLAYLIRLEDEEVIQICLDQFYQAQNMSDQFVALYLINQTESSKAKECLNHFYKQWQNDSLVLNKWFSAQAASRSKDVLDQVKALTKHPAFEVTNPNKVRALLGSFTQNRIHFHREDGSGYNFLAERILEIDQFNPHLSARLAGVLSNWRRFDSKRQELILGQLEYLANQKKISSNLFEVVTNLTQHSSKAKKKQ